MASFDEQGRHLPDPRPVEVPVDFRRPLSLQDEIKRFVRAELAQRAGSLGAETFEEADDFDVGDDPDVVAGTEYELDEEMLAQPAPPAKPPKANEAGAGDGGAGASAPASTSTPTPPPAMRPRAGLSKFRQV